MNKFGLVLAAAATTALLTPPLATASADTATPPPQATPLEKVRAYVEPSIVYLDLFYYGWVWDTYHQGYVRPDRPFVYRTHCTGFVVSPDGYLGTAGHCVIPDDDIDAAIAARAAVWAANNNYYGDPTLTARQILSFGYTVEGQGDNPDPELDVTAYWGASASGIETWESRAAQVVDSQEFMKGDTALLKVNETGLNALPLADETDPQVGSEVVSIGYPASVNEVTDVSLEPSFKPGAISSTKTVGNGLYTVFEVSAAVSGGMSGGPTVNLAGDVVGINSFGNRYETQPFNFITPAGQLESLLAGAGVNTQPSADTQAYRRGLDAYFAGDRAAAVAALTQVTRSQPSNALAAEYLGRARDLPVPEKQAPAPASAPVETEGSSFSGPLLVGVGVAAVLVLLGGVFVTRSRRRPPVGSPSSAEEVPASTASSGPVAAASDPAQPVVPPQRTPGFGPPPQPVDQRVGVGAAPDVEGTATSSTVPRPAEPAPPGHAPQTADSTGYCTSCGTPFARADQRFCGSCGTAR
jgi:serine protease Do